MKLIPQKLTQKVGRQLLTMQKNAPRTFFIAGIVGIIGSTVLACRATLKLNETLDDMSQKVDTAKEVRKSSPGTYLESNFNKDMAVVYTRGTISLVKLYAPAIILGGASIAALTGSHVALSRRNAGLTAAYSAVAASFEAYRDRVRQEVGDEKELEFHHAILLEKMAVDGKTEIVRRADPNRWSPYAKFFDEYNVNWKKNSEHNRLFVQCQQNYANHLLQARGHVFLNEVYDMLGIDRSSAGQVVGWIIGQEGDNYIDFGMFEAANSQFVNGWERSVILDFNVDGVIYDKI